MSNVKPGKAQVMWGHKNKRTGLIDDAFNSLNSARANKDCDVSVVKVEVKEIK